ncbi:MAG: hypothetical protein V2J12_05360, partial [Gammaproteobacteria bacterium]|nr:hypothetical protein [Gammaproteobacteria bacterium]
MKSRDPKDPAAEDAPDEALPPGDNDNVTEPDYKVGYKKPPRHTRFTKGVSGNRLGRPKKQKPDA